jgi:general secretion pathway protein G
MNACRPRTGFTLIELLVVLAIVATLLTLALPRYSQSVGVAQDRVLAENLRITREAIDKFYADTHRYPDSLDELVERRYLRSKPMDPILGKDDAWQIIAPPAEQKGQVADIKSTADGSTADGVAYGDL